MTVVVSLPHIYVSCCLLSEVYLTLLSGFNPTSGGVAGVAVSRVTTFEFGFYTDVHVGSICNLCSKCVTDMQKRLIYTMFLESVLLSSSGDCHYTERYILMFLFLRLVAVFEIRPVTP
jgi:hypothetical protein